MDIKFLIPPYLEQWTMMSLTLFFKVMGMIRSLLRGDQIHEKLFAAMNLSYSRIKHIQELARSSKPLSKPKWPVILMRTLKGWTTIKELDGVKIEGNCKSHQVPIKDVKENPEHLKLLENWLLSYKPSTLFTPEGKPKPEIFKALPKS